MFLTKTLRKVTTQKSGYATYVDKFQNKATKFQDLCRQSGPLEAEKFFQKLPLTEKNNLNFHQLLKNFSEHKNYRKLEEYFDLMVQNNIKPLPNTFTVLHRSFIDVDIFKMRNYLILMNSYHYIPSIRLASKYISNCFKSNLPKLAIECDDIFGHKLERDSIYFNFLIQGMINNSDLTKGVEFFGKMIQLDITPDIYTFTLLIKGYLKNNDFETSLKLLDEMEKLNVKPNIVTYNHFLDHLQSNFDEEKLNLILQLMRSDDVKFTEKSNTMLIKLYLKKNKYEKAIEIFNQQPKKNTYYLNLFIHYFAEKGDLGEMNFFYKAFEEYQLTPDSVTYGTLIQGYSRKKEFQKAEEMLKENLNRNIPISDKTVGFLMKGYCENLMPKKAEDLLARLSTYKLKPDHELITYLMKCYYDLNAPDKARKCFLLMKENRMKTPIYTFLLRFNGEFKHDKSSLETTKAFRDLLSKSENYQTIKKK